MIARPGQRIWVTLSKNLEPFAVTHSKFAGNSETLEPNTVAVYTPCHIMQLQNSHRPCIQTQLQNSHSHSFQGPTVAGCKGSAQKCELMHRETEMFPDQATYWSSSWSNLDPKVRDGGRRKECFTGFSAHLLSTNARPGSKSAGNGRFSLLTKSLSFLCRNSFYLPC